MRTATSLAAAAAFMLATGASHAADWSDTAISWRHGDTFREPFNPNNIRKDIFALTHSSGYQYGANYFNVDLLQSDHNDPGSLTQKSGAQEAYVVYRNTTDIGKVLGRDLVYGAIKGLGATIGFDWNAKNDVAYNSRKRMLVFGPTLMWDVPGYLNTSIMLVRESNAPSGAFPPISEVRGRYSYDTHPMFSASWGVPVVEGRSFEGYFNFIAGKGRDEVGNSTGAETHLDMQIMVDLAQYFRLPKKRFRLGFEYEFWNNKFGNTERTTGNRGQRASTPMVRAEYHF